MVVDATEGPRDFRRPLSPSVFTLPPLRSRIPYLSRSPRPPSPSVSFRCALCPAPVLSLHPLCKPSLPTLSFSLSACLSLWLGTPSSPPHSRRRPPSPSLFPLEGLRPSCDPSLYPCLCLSADLPLLLLGRGESGCRGVWGLRSGNRPPPLGERDRTPDSGPNRERETRRGWVVQGVGLWTPTANSTRGTPWTPSVRPRGSGTTILYAGIPGSNRGLGEGPVPNPEWTPWLEGLEGGVSRDHPGTTRRMSGDTSLLRGK